VRQEAKDVRIWLIGADQTGTSALRQLRKSPDIEIVVSDSIERPRAVAERVIDALDHVESVTSVNVNALARRIRPDLILVDSRAMQRAVSNMPGGVAFAESLLSEMQAASEFPLLVL
jgi:predicted homoserine dehydrogenase-like protein